MVFRQVLNSNAWLKQFLMSYCFNDSFVYFDEKQVLHGMGTKKLGQGKYFKQQLLKHIKEKKYLMMEKQLTMESFQYLIYVIEKLKKHITRHYSITVEYLVRLAPEDIPFVIDILTKKFKLSPMQRQALKRS